MKCIFHENSFTQERNNTDNGYCAEKVSKVRLPFISERELQTMQPNRTEFVCFNLIPHILEIQYQIINNFQIFIQFIKARILNKRR